MSKLYLGKLTGDDRKFFNERKGGKSIHKSDRAESPKKDKSTERNLPIRGQ